MILRAVQCCIPLDFSPLSPGMGTFLGDQVSRDLSNMGKAQDRKLWSLDPQKDRQGIWNGFSSKNLCAWETSNANMAGHVSPQTFWTNPQPLSCELTKCIDSTFTLSLKKKWKKCSYIKARLKASFLLCRQTWVTMCSLFDIEEGWLE